MDLQTKVNYLESECANLKYENLLLHDKIQPLKNQPIAAKASANYHENVNGKLISTLYSVIDEKQSKLGQLEEALNCQVIQERVFDQVKQKNEEIKLLKQHKERQMEEIAKLKHENDLLQLQHKQEGMFQVELEHLRADNCRLLELVNRTNLAFSQTDGMRFLKEIANQPLNVEQLLWVPEKAFQFAHSFSLKYNVQELSQSHMDLLLFELNKIYVEREKAIIKQMNSKFNLAAKSIENNISPKLDEFVAQNTISRLKNSLRETRQENIQLNSNKPLTIKFQNTKPPSRPSSAIRSRKDSVNKDNSNAIQKKQFIDGAIWMNNRIEKLLGNVTETEVIKQLRNQVKIFEKEASNLLLNV